MKGQPRDKDIQSFFRRTNITLTSCLQCVGRDKEKKKGRTKRQREVLTGGRNLACDPGYIPGPKAATDTNVPPCAGEDIRVRDIHAGIKETAKLCTR